MRVTLAQALRITAAYASIFNYSLSPEELRFWCVYRVVPQRYVPKIVSPRRHEKYSTRKWHIANRVAVLLRLVPTIELVGVTGALAMDNAGKEDDIDFIIITKPSALWITRLLVTLLLDLFSLRRRPGDSEYKDKICLNMFMSSNAFALARNERDLFTAHEVLQMKPLWDQRGTYQAFLNANRWVKKFLPTAWASIVKQNTFVIRRSALSFFEPMARSLQLLYMRKRRTTEVISDTIIRFHPNDARVWIYRELQKRLRGTNMPLDKIFYGR